MIKIMKAKEDLEFKFRYYELISYKRDEDIVSIYYEDDFIGYVKVFIQDGKEYICINDTRWSLSAFTKV